MPTPVGAPLARRVIGAIPCGWTMEGADTFYVTRYDEHSSELGGYNNLMTQQRRSRMLVTVGNDPGESL
nr:hypothetical protein [Tanacetum cinerariifolium]